MGSFRSWVCASLSLVVYFVVKRFCYGFAFPALASLLCASVLAWQFVLRVPELRRPLEPEPDAKTLEVPVSKASAAEPKAEVPVPKASSAEAKAEPPVAGAAPPRAQVAPEPSTPPVASAAKVPSAAQMPAAAEEQSIAAQTAEAPEPTGRSPATAAEALGEAGAGLPEPEVPLESASEEPLEASSNTAQAAGAETRGEAVPEIPAAGAAPGALLEPEASGPGAEAAVAPGASEAPAEKAEQSAAADDSASEQGQPEEENEFVDFPRAQALRLEGNDLFKAGKMHDAREVYSEAIHLMPIAEKAETAVLYCNRAACMQKLGRWDDTIADCKRAIELRPDYVKAYIRRSGAFEAQDKWHDAFEDLKKAAELDPAVKSREYKHLAVLEKRAQEQFEKDKGEMLGKLKDLGNNVLGKFGMSLDNFKMEQDPNTGSYSIKFQN